MVTLIYVPWMLLICNDDTCNDDAWPLLQPVEFFTSSNNVLYLYVNEFRSF